MPPAIAQNSTTRGFIRPAAEPAPLEGEALNNFFQEMIVGITGLQPTLVRPTAQTEPGNIPTQGEAWCAFDISLQGGDNFPFIGHHAGDDDVAPYDQLQRHEMIVVPMSFYDTGTNGMARKYAGLMRDGLAIPQNLEVLTRNGMGFREVSNLVSVPVIVKTRWNYRVDFSFSLFREVVRRYPVENVDSAVGTLVTDSGIELNIGVTNPDAPAA